MKRLALISALMIAHPAFAQNTTTAQPSTGTPIKEDVVAPDTPAEKIVIAVPTMPTPANASTPAGDTGTLGRKVADVVTADLGNSGLFAPKGPGQVRGISMSEVSTPSYGYWQGLPTDMLVQGYVRSEADGRITVGCYIYDTDQGQELTRAGWVVQPGDWRRAAHRCADTVYSRLTGEGKYFDSQVVYVSETGPKDKRIKRIAVMDQDGANHRFLTNGQDIVITPRFSPDGNRVVYMSYVGKEPRIYVQDVNTGTRRLVVNERATTFAPRFSPDGKWIIFSMANNGNTDIYKVSSEGGKPVRLTSSPAIDTGGSFSPDGSRIVFESDRSGSQQLYVMNADGSNQQRISFGAGRYATPEWSPRGDLIAFTQIAGNFRIGTMTPSGDSLRLLTNGWQDEGPTWSPNGRVLQFFRSSAGEKGTADVWSVDATGAGLRKVDLPLNGSDPAWGKVRD